MVYCASHNRRHHRWRIYGSLTQDRPTEFLDFTSLTLDEFQLLVPPFEAAFQVHMREWRLDGNPGPPASLACTKQVTGTVLATVVAVDTLTNRVKVRTQAGQVIELDTSAKDRQIGEQVTLIVPR